MSKTEAASATTLSRQELLASVKRVAPALSSKDIIPSLACFCFDGQQVTAYDDIVALTTPCKTELTGAVRGRLLLDFLSSTKAEGVDVSVEGETARFKAGRSRLETSVLARKAFLFAMPELEKAVTVRCGDGFLPALRLAAVSMGTDPSNPWRLGVTVVAAGGKVLLYSTDNKSACRANADLQAGKDFATILPPRFVSTLLDNEKEDPVASLTLAKSWVVATFPSKTQLFSKAVSGCAPEKYSEVLGPVLAKVKDASVALPKGLERALDRALTVVAYEKDNPFSTVTVKGDRLVLETKTGVANVRDALPIAPGSLPECSFAIHPLLLQRWLAHAKSMAVLPETCVVLKGAAVYVASVVH